MKLLLLFIVLSSTLVASQPTVEDVIASRINQITSPQFSGKVRLVEIQGAYYLQKCGRNTPVSIETVRKAAQDLENEIAKTNQKN